MPQYSDIADALLRDSDLLKKLRPTESNVPRLLKIRAASDADLAGGRSISDPVLFPLVRAGLVYASDALSESHMIVQGISGDESAYWHGMIHRREGDFENARRWCRRAGALPVFGELHRAANTVTSLMSAQVDWDPYLFTGLCEQEKFGDPDRREELVKLQRVEFEIMFDYAWRRTVKG